MPTTDGAKAYRKKGQAFAEERKKRQARSAAQKAAREAQAYDDCPKGLTRELLIEQHRALRDDFYRRQAERRAAA